MKKIGKIVLIIMIVMLLPAGVLLSQEIKSEQRLKVVIADKSGLKVEIDTLIKDDMGTDTIKLKNGAVIFMEKEDGTKIIKQAGSGDKDIIITLDSDEKGDKGDKGEKKMTKTITLISSDSGDIKHVGKGRDIVIVNGKNQVMEGEGGKVVTWSSSSGKSSGNSYYFVSDQKSSDKSGNKTYSVKVSDDNLSDDIDKTKYVIAKDGLVISVEGTDEAKVKNIVDKIETELGISKENKNVNKEVKAETKKPTKK